MVTKLANWMKKLAKAIKSFTAAQGKDFISKEYADKRRKMLERIITEYPGDPELYKKYRQGQERLDKTNEIVHGTAEIILTIIEESKPKSTANVGTVALDMISGIAGDLVGEITNAIQQTAMDSRKEKYGIIDFDPTDPEVMRMVDNRIDIEMFEKRHKKKIDSKINEAILKSWTVVKETS